MKLNKNELKQLSKTDLLRVLWYVRYKYIIRRISYLQPYQMVVPVVGMQIVAFILFAFYEYTLFDFAISMFFIIGIALFPMTLQKTKKKKYHWVKNKNSEGHQ